MSIETIQTIAEHSIVLLMAAFGARLCVGFVVDRPWASTEFVFPIVEWVALGGAVIGAAAAVAIWYGLEL